jgi:alcohol dehydrogenase
VQIGMPLREHAEVNLPLLELVYSRQITILGTRGMAAKGFPELFKLIAEGRLHPEKLISKRIPLDQAGEVLAAMNSYSGVGITVIDRF